jgi:hypothetical protein
VWNEHHDSVMLVTGRADQTVMPFVVVSMSNDHFSQLQSSLQGHSVCKGVGVSTIFPLHPYCYLHLTI